MTIDNLDTIFYTSLFLIPGYIIEEIIGTLMPSKSYSDGIKFLRCIAYSILNCAIWSWAYFLVDKYTNSDSVWYWILGVAVTAIGSTLLGLLIGVIRCKVIIRTIFNIQTEHPIPTAWEYKFSRTNDTRWVVIHLKDGEVFYGKYDTSSFVSSDPSERDVYIEKIYSYEKTGQPWKPIPNSDGVLINMSEIRNIEFYKYQEVENEKGE